MPIPFVSGNPAWELGRGRGACCEQPSSKEQGAVDVDVNKKTTEVMCIYRSPKNKLVTYFLLHLDFFLFIYFFLAFVYRVFGFS
jgi:hypothetical protein